MTTSSLSEAIEKGIRKSEEVNAGPNAAVVIIRFEVIDFLAHKSLEFTKDKDHEIEKAMVDFFEEVRR